ncbi:MAG: M23 family metallopeptidase [bacterium JZ-2024 1]
MPHSWTSLLIMWTRFSPKTNNRSSASTRFLILIVTQVILVAPALGQSPSFIFPLPAYPDRITGGFGEFRFGHLHAGIDIGTRLEVGLPVVAADSGFVAWVSSSDSGYGKALLLQHPSGYATFYGHLDDFAPRIKEKLPVAPSFSIDFQPGDIVVSAGEIIAFSGETGAGFPHLHFEIQFGRLRLNPLQFRLAPLDTTPPVPTRLYLIPADPFSGAPLVLPLQDDKGQPLQVIHVPASGRFWVELEAHDAGAVTSKLVPSRVEAHSGDYCFALEMDAFAVPTNQRIYEVYNPAASHLSPTHFTFRLYDLSSTTCSPVWSADKPLEVTLLDPAGNRSSFRVISSANAPDAPVIPETATMDVAEEPAFSGSSGPPIFALPSGLFVSGRLSPDFVLNLAGETLLHGSPNFPRLGAIVSLSSYPFPAKGFLRSTPTLKPGSGNQWDFLAGSASLTQNYTMAIGGLELTLPAGALRRPTSIAVVRSPIHFLPPLLRPVSDAIYISPYGEPLAQPLIIQTGPHLPLTARSGLYRLDTFASTWKVVPFTKSKSQMLYEAPYFATFAVLDDHSPPEIRDPYTYRDRLALPIRDAGLGVDPATIVVTLGGKPVTGQWDPDWGHFLTVLPASSIPKTANLRVRASDRAGNLARRLFHSPVEPKPAF